MVCDAFLQGRIAEIAEYCRGDVYRTREIYKRLTFWREPESYPQLDSADLVAPWEKAA